jgi:hypothetical protein
MSMGCIILVRTVVHFEIPLAPFAKGGWDGSMSNLFVEREVCTAFAYAGIMPSNLDGPHSKESESFDWVGATMVHSVANWIST